MIKILKEGTLPKPKKIIYKGTCSNCGCVFEFEDGDIKSQERRPSGKITVDCPCCGSDRIFAEAKEKLVKEEIKVLKENGSEIMVTKGNNKLYQVGKTLFALKDDILVSVSTLGVPFTKEELEKILNGDIDE